MIGSFKDLKHYIKCGYDKPESIPLAYEQVDSH